MKRVLVMVVFVSVGWGQQGNAVGRQVDYIAPGSVQGVFQRHVRSLGDRISKPGHERIGLVGELTRGTQKDSFSAVVEFPGKVRIQYGSANRVVKFDGSKTTGPNNVDDVDEALLESFAYDSAETFLQTVVQGVVPRILGYGFAVEGVKGFGSSLDIYETVQTIKSGKQEMKIVKRFGFDSGTGLLHWIIYPSFKGSAPVNVMTELSQYEAVDSYMLPKRIVRREGGVVVMEINLTVVQTGPKQNDGIF